MDQLQTFLSASGTRQSALAAALGISRAYMSQLVSGLKQPSLDLAFKIERATEGAVRASAWVEPERSQPEPQPQQENLS